MALDDEQQKQLRDILRLALGAKLTPDKFNIFVRRVETSMDVFLNERKADKLTFRQIHDRLRKLWFLVQKDDPPVGLIRAEIDKLPDAVIEQIELRVPSVVSALYGEDRLRKVTMAGGKTIDVKDIRTRSWAANGGFRVWTQHADPSLLVRAAALLTAEGGRIVLGRSRGKGKRSRPQFEPDILGVTKGADDEKPKGGRPRADPAQNLVQNLAIDWLLATGSPPEPSRSDQTGFGKLIYAVFSWTAATDNACQDAASGKAEYALRDDWRRFSEAKHGAAK